MKNIFPLLVTFLTTTILAYEPPLPFFPPPGTQRSTNLAAELFPKLSAEQVQKRVEKVFQKMDKDRDGTLTSAEILKVFEKSGEYPAIVQDLMLSSTANPGAENLTVAAFSQVYTEALTRNFTVYPSICKDVSERLNLCKTLKKVTDEKIKETFLSEHAKCRTGVAGLHEYAFQRCILGTPCGSILDCVALVQESMGDAVIDASNKLLGKSVHDISKLSSDDPKFRAFMEKDGVSAWQVVGTLAETTLWAGLLGFVGQIAITVLKEQLTPLITGGITSAVTGLTGWLTAFLTPEVWLVIGSVVVAGVIGSWIVGQILPLIWDLGNDIGSQLYMETWDPYAGELEPKCEWATYFPKGCTRNSVLKEHGSFAVCDAGGDMFRDRECSNKDVKFFYQQNCFLNGCRHLCYKANFECGNDNYNYKNMTQFVYTAPTSAMNPYIFNPNFAGKQFVALDARYVYHMSECRDTCDRYSSQMTPDGVSECIGFVLRAPDPLLDPRPAYAKKQVCTLIARNEAGEQNDGFDEAVFPQYLNGFNDVLGYDVMRHNDFPPMIVAFKQ